MNEITNGEGDMSLASIHLILTFSGQNTKRVEETKAEVN